MPDVALAHPTLRRHVFDPGAIVAVTNRHGVRFVVIGGMAAMVRDLPVPATVDIDITPSRDPDNLERLAAVFDELDAGLLTADQGGTWFPRHPLENWAQYDTLYLMSKYGRSVVDDRARVRWAVGLPIRDVMRVVLGGPR